MGFSGLLNCIVFAKSIGANKSKASASVFLILCPLIFIAGIATRANIAS
ncbi:hypothetical protein THF1C08_90097 [Vibrio jasicida]|nr:hypothetical protein THF1C08_90097 [Vibrio jasicida]CAH1605084.1 hypothetical protein THF5G08_110133 [Vibrio jasicida]